MNSQSNDLRLAAYAADDAYQVELVRVYGPKNAGQMRYCGSLHTDERLIESRTKKIQADMAWRSSLEC